MKYAFFGTPEFSAIVLEKLIASGFIPEAVICNPDRPVGRKKIITPPPVKRLIANGKWQIEILQPEDLKTISRKLLAISPDLFIVAAYSKILPKEIIDIPRLGTIGVHPSLLPKYRGASPIQGAILGCEKKTGITLYLMDEKMDHGPILAQRELGIQDTNYKLLAARLAELGGNLLVETLPKFVAGETKPEPQNEQEATYTKKLVREDAFIEPKELNAAIKGESPDKAEEIERKVRAFNPEPGAWTYAKALRDYGYRLGENKQVKILAVALENGKLTLKTIQVEGEKPKQAAGYES